MAAREEVLESTKKNNVSIISFKCSELDIDENNLFYNELKKLTNQGDIFILVNFAGIKYISSLVIASLISGLKNTRSQGGSLKLCCLSEKIRQTLEVVQLNKILEIFKTQDEALAAGNWIKQEGTIEFK